MKFNAKQESQNCIKWIKNWFDNQSGNARGIVVGISGGKDSTIAAQLCAEAVGKSNVFGVLMPNGRQPDIADSTRVCSHIGINYKIINIAGMYDSLQKAIECEDIKIHNQTRTNIPPRIRMTILYAIAQELGLECAVQEIFLRDMLGIQQNGEMQLVILTLLLILLPMK